MFFIVLSTWRSAAGTGTIVSYRGALASIDSITKDMCGGCLQNVHVRARCSSRGACAAPLGVVVAIVAVDNAAADANVAVVDAELYAALGQQGGYEEHI